MSTRSPLQVWQWERYRRLKGSLMAMSSQLQSLKQLKYLNGNELWRLEQAKQSINAILKQFDRRTEHLRKEVIKNGTQRSDRNQKT